jgi:hypothetical protein
MQRSLFEPVEQPGVILQFQQLVLVVQQQLQQLFLQFLELKLFLR